MCSGGDCAGMNPAIKYFVDYVYAKNAQPYFIYDGLEGLIDGNIKKASYEDVAGIMHEGGTQIRSSRSRRFFEYAYRKIAYENLQKFGIDKVVVLGGDGSFRAMDQFFKDFKVNFVGIPSTIDNDIFGTDYCLGVDSALNMIRIAIDSLRDTSSSFKRACVVETMGRECGYLALVSAITCGAEICLIPEVCFDLHSILQRLKEEVQNGRKYIVCVVSEGTKMTSQIVNLLEHELGFETRATVLGHIQRGGNPTTYDRLMATQFVTRAVDKLFAHIGGNVIVFKDNEFDFAPVSYVAGNKSVLSQELLNLATRLYK